MLLHQVKILVKEIQVVRSYAQSTKKLFLLALFLMVVDVAKKENLEFMPMWIFSRHGSKQVMKWLIVFDINEMKFQCWQNLHLLF